MWRYRSKLYAWMVTEGGVLGVVWEGAVAIGKRHKDIRRSNSLLRRLHQGDSLYIRYRPL